VVDNVTTLVGSRLRRIHMPLATPLLILLLLALSGLADSYGFFYASKIWQNGVLSWPALGKSALGWIVGISLYIVSLRPMAIVGVTSAEVQTTVWFAMTIIGVVILSGRFFHWTKLDQAIGVTVVLALGWLLARTSA
jgi:hypothetical protein